MLHLHTKLARSTLWSINRCYVKRPSKKSQSKLGPNEALRRHQEILKIQQELFNESKEIQEEENRNKQLYEKMVESIDPKKLEMAQEDYFEHKKDRLHAKELPTMSDEQFIEQLGETYKDMLRDMPKAELDGLRVHLYGKKIESGPDAYNVLAREPIPGKTKEESEQYYLEKEAETFKNLRSASDLEQDLFLRRLAEGSGLDFDEIVKKGPPKNIKKMMSDIKNNKLNMKEMRKASRQMRKLGKQVMDDMDDKPKTSQEIEEELKKIQNSFK
ncbi:hypothetical protein AKO1_011271 [Acrasis kona]|uniref:Uncharacterized protein n=1 Tax=Acrasis kona TaxID=1008807 RepID=A0AAW2YWT4_9EUKA